MAPRDHETRRNLADRRKISETFLLPSEPKANPYLCEGHCPQYWLGVLTSVRKPGECQRLNSRNIFDLYQQ